MKRLSLSILLLLFGASNVQAIPLSPIKWAQQTVGWVKENKKKFIAATLATGVGLYFGYKARQAYPNLSTIAAMRKSLSSLLSKRSCEICGPRVWGVAAATICPTPGIEFIARASSEHDAHCVLDATSAFFLFTLTLGFFLLKI